MNVKQVFGSNLKYYRKKQCLSQERLAEKAGVTPKHLSKIETGGTFVTAELLENLARILGVSASALFYFPQETASDASPLGRLDTIIEKELARTAEVLKLQLRLTLPSPASGV